METDFTKGRIVPALVRFVFPIMFAMLIQSLYGAVDLMIVGQFSDAINVSAVSVGSHRTGNPGFILCPDRPVFYLFLHMPEKIHGTALTIS